MKKILSFFFLALIVLISPAQSEEPSIPSATVIDGTADVLFTNAQRASRSSAVKVEGLEGGHGSGTYLEMSGHHLVITARHVVDRNDIYYISTGSEKVVGQVIWKSQTKDMAVLKIPRLTSRTAVTLARTGELVVGEEITYTGYPSDYQLLTTKAHVAGFENSPRSTLLQGFVWFGYSGSGGFDNSGRLRTIIFAIAVENFRGHPALLETLVYTHEISRKEVAQIRAALD
jgi:hypothetical protein